MNKDQIRESRSDFQQHEIAEALELCKDKAAGVLGQLLTELVDSGAQQLAQKAASPKEPDPAFWSRAAQQIQNCSAAMQRNAKQSFARCFESPNPHECWRENRSSPAELSLVDTQVFEQELLVERMAVRASIDTQMQFTQLNRRYCFMRDRRIKPADNPLGPTLMGRVLLAAIESSDLPPRAVGELITLLEQRLTSALGQLYSDLNSALIKRGILPGLKHHIWRTADALHGGRGKSRAAMTESQRRALMAKYSAQSDHQLGAVLSELLGLERNSVQEPDLGRQYKASGQVLLGALDRLETEFSQEPSLMKTLEALQAQGEIEPLTESMRQTMSLADRLADWFQQPFLRNAGSPQASLAIRLGSHIARLAIVDPLFLKDEKHPARRALDRLRAFADYLEIVNVRLSQQVLSQFDDRIEQFENASVGQQPMADLLTALDRDLANYQSMTQLNEARLKNWFEGFVAIEQSRVNRNSEESEPNQLRLTGMLGTALERQAGFPTRTQGVAGSRFEEYEAAQPDRRASIDNLLKPGRWVQDLERQDEYQLPQFKRFYQDFGGGRWYVFVDGMGLLAGVISGRGVAEKLEQGLIKPLI